MQSALRLLAAAALMPVLSHSQVLPGGGAQPAAQPVNVDSGPAPKQQQKNPLLGDALPFLDPGSETVQWDGKMFSVTNNRVFRAMLETYLASPEANSDEDKAYRAIIDEIDRHLAPGNNGGHPDLPGAVALLPAAAQYKADARLCDSLANAIWGVWQAQRNVANLRATNEAMQTRVNSMHFHAEHHTAPLATRSATSTKGGGSSNQNNQQSPQQQAGQLGMIANYIKNITEYEAKMKANEAAMGLSQVTAKLEFQALIIQFAVQRRFEHVVMACRFYRNIFSSDPNGILQLSKGSDAEKMFATSLGTSPTIGALDAFANEMIGKVDTAVQAFDNLLARGDTSSASQRISEAFMVGEFLPRVQRVPATKKLMVLDYTRDSNQLLSAIEVKDYTSAEAVITRMRSKAKDADENLIKAQQAVEVARGASDLYLNEAKVAAMKGDQKSGADALKHAAEIWPTNPKLKEFTSMIGSNADIKTQAVLDFDKFLSQGNYRQIFNDLGRYSAAVMDDPKRRQELAEVGDKMKKITTVIALATGLSQKGDPAGAWETVEKTASEFPGDPELEKLRTDLGLRAVQFVSALKTAKEHEDRRQSGSALAWYLRARSQYPRSDYATEGISRIVAALHVRPETP